MPRHSGSTTPPGCRAPATARRRSGRRARRCSGRSGRTRSGKAAIAAWQAMLLPALAEWRRYPALAVRRRLSRAAGAGRGGAGGDLSRRGAAPSRDAAEGQQAAPGGPGGGRGPACRRRWPRLAVLPDPELQQAMADGFGADAAGEDRFDCVLGVLCVLNVLAGNRPDTAPADPWIRAGRAGCWARPRCRRQREWRVPQDAPKVAFGNGHTPT